MKEREHKTAKAWMVLSGVAIGAINGLLGGGGGMLAVPVLQKAGKLDTQTAHATAIAVMLPLCIISTVVYTLQGVFAIRTGLLSCAFVTLGGAFGAVLLGKISKEWISLLFYALMLAGGIEGAVRWFG